MTGLLRHGAGHRDSCLQADGTGHAPGEWGIVAHLLITFWQLCGEKEQTNQMNSFYSLSGPWVLFPANNLIPSGYASAECLLVPTQPRRVRTDGTAQAEPAISCPIKSEFPSGPGLCQVTPTQLLHLSPWSPSHPQNIS